MSQKINPIALQQYVISFTSQILTDFYSTNSTASGSDLLKITPLRQINLGIISRLFESWKSTSQAFRSPYFDFDNGEVKDAMEVFMNVVSQHISVKREDLQPLLTEATQDALVLLFAPDEYFETKLKALPSFTFTTSHADKLVKYTQIHNAIAKGLVQRLNDSKAESVYANEVLRWLDELLASNSDLDDVQQYVDQFSSIKELTPAKILRNPLPAVETPAAKLPENKSFFETVLGEKEATSFRVSTPAPNVEEESRVGKNVRRNTDNTHLEGSLNHQFKVEIPEPTDNNKYGNVKLKVESIGNSIALGQRFMFINQLFNGSKDDFEQAVTEIDNSSTLETALNMITHKLAVKYNWNLKDEAVIDLLTIVKRKFS
jgi:hypothetical protein